MGLIKAALGAAGGTLADQWKEFFVCEAIDKDILVVKGQKQTSKRSSNTKGEDNVITSGSGISVADGQCMLIVEQGKVMEICAEPGVYTYDSSLSPSVFAGNLKEGLIGSFKDAWERFKLGGGAGRDQRIYYFNTKEILGNKYGTPNPVPFKVIIDKEIGKSISIDVRCNGEYSYKIVNPMLFYTNVCGNVSNEYNRSEIDSQLKAELLNALQPALAKVAQLGVDYSEIPLHTTEISNALNEELSASWGEKRGIMVFSFGVNSVSVSDEDKKKIQAMQEAVIMSNATLAAGNIAAATADAMRTAASNPNGAMAGFMGMGMAMNSGAGMANNLFAAGAAQQQMQQQMPQQQMPQQQMPQQQVQQPVAGVNGWQCSCGAVNQGKFCPECGAKKPAGAPMYKCDKCGWTPADPTKPPKFCPECGDPFGDEDIV